MLNHRIASLFASLCALAAASPLAAADPTFVAVGPTDESLAAASVPRFDHVVIAIMENTSDSSIIGNTSQAPYINSLAGAGAQFSNSHAVTHPSEPNYLALFSGSTQGVTDDSCPHTFSGANLGSELIAAGFTFKGYSESMPSNGYTGCTSGTYARKHNPWVNFSNVPAASNLTFASYPTDFTTLPTLSFVVPNLCNDMHDCSISTGDSWLQSHLDAYVQWARTHNSLLILTWDEDDSSTSANQIPTLFVGANVTVGTYTETINHYSVLRTLEDMYGLAATGSAASANPITDVWSATTPDYTLSASPTTQTVCAGNALSPTTLSLGASNGYNKAVTLSLPGLDSAMFNGGSFSPNPLTPATPPATSVLSLSTQSAAAAGNYTVAIQGSDSSNLVHSGSISVTLNRIPNGPALVTPANGASGVAVTPTLTWNATSGATGYTVEVATDASFATLVASHTGSATSWALSPALAANTTYYWRLRASGTCGTGSNSLTSSFTTAAGNVAPVANFSFTTNALVANFTDSSTDSDGTIASRAWTFGDSGTSTATNPSHTYAAAGTYSVTLSVTDNGGLTNAKTSSVTVSGGGSNVLTNGVPVTGLTAPTGTDKVFTLVVPAGATGLKFVTSGGTGDADLYARFGSAPTTTVNDCKSEGSTAAETCSIASAQAGTYYVLVHSYATYSGVSLTGSYSTGGGGNVLTNGVPVTGLSATAGTNTAVYTLVVPAGKTNLTFKTAGSNGDADLYVRLGSAPGTTAGTYDCRPYTNSSTETCTFSSPTAGTYYVMVRAYASFTGLSLTGTYTP